MPILLTWKLLSIILFIFVVILFSLSEELHLRDAFLQRCIYLPSELSWQMYPHGAEASPIRASSAEASLHVICDVLSLSLPFSLK